MRVLALSPGSLQLQLERLPALAVICDQLGAKLQVACDPSCKPAWELLACTEKCIPITFDASPALADWANLLGCVREPDFEVCLNFVDGPQVNLMLAMSRIPTRLARSGFAATACVADANGWPAQRLSSWLKPLGLDLDANAFRLSLPASDLEKIRASHPSGNGPLLLLAPSGKPNDWPAERWTSLPQSVQSRLDGLRCVHLKTTGISVRDRAAAVACADVVLSSCPLTQRLAVYNGTPLVALGTSPSELPQRPEIRSLGSEASLAGLSEDDVLNALGF